MKCQYFGDKKDLFKWDLALTIAQRLGLGITYIPMLTEPDNTGQGNDRAFPDGWPGTKNVQLVRLLRECFNEGRLCINEIKPFFEQIGIQFYSYQNHRHNDGTFFSHGARGEYFTNIPASSLSKRLIFLDPGIGFEGKKLDSKAPWKYVLYGEAQHLHAMMGPESVLMIFQFYRGRGLSEKHRPVYFSRVRAKISDAQVSYIHNTDDLTFFFTTKQDARYAVLSETLQAYHQTYSATTTWSAPP